MAITHVDSVSLSNWEDWTTSLVWLIQPTSSLPLQISTVRARAKSLQVCPAFCDPMDYSPLGSSVHGIIQARILEWIAMPSSRGSSWPRDRTCISHVSCIDRWVGFFTTSATREAQTSTEDETNTQEIYSTSFSWFHLGFMTTHGGELYYTHFVEG